MNPHKKCVTIVKRMKNYMVEALKEAEISMEYGDVPIGCIIEKNGEIIGRSGNKVERQKDPTAHAEIEAIKEATATLGRERLEGCNMYVTLEPCSMCAGAIVLARIEHLYIGALDPKAGACGSVLNVVAEERLNHRVKVTSGILNEECSSILKDFFKEIRKRNGGSSK